MVVRESFFCMTGSVAFRESLQYEGGRSVVVRESLLYEGGLWQLGRVYCLRGVCGSVYCMRGVSGS